LEHALALEQLNVVTQMHRAGSLQKVLSVETYQAKLAVLNKEIALRIGKVLNFTLETMQSHQRSFGRCNTKGPSDYLDLNTDDNGSFSRDGL
jgi:hypothetical protein